MNRFEDILTRTLEFLLAMALLGIAGVVVLQVILSFALNSSITGANEIITKLFVYTTAVGAAVAVGRREHIAISVAVETLPKRLQGWLDKFSLVAVGAFNAVLLAYSVRWIAATGHYSMPTTQLPQMVAQLSIPIGCGLALLYCGLLLFRPAAEQADDKHQHEPGGADRP